MNKLGLIALAVVILSGRVCADGKPPKFELQAARCLVDKKFLSPQPAHTVGFLVDAKSYPGREVLYLVDYAAPGGPEGTVFTIFLKNKGHRTFDIQNNARFVGAGSGTAGIQFADPPLGGMWTQEHLATAIRKIGREPRFSIATSDLNERLANTQCESYADK